MAGYPSTLDCHACQGTLVARRPAGHGTPRVEYACEDCGRAGCIRARDNKTIGPVFETRRYSDALLAVNDALIAADTPEVSPT